MTDKTDEQMLQAPTPAEDAAKLRSHGFRVNIKKKLIEFVGVPDQDISMLFDSEYIAIFQDIIGHEQSYATFHDKMIALLNSITSSAKITYKALEAYKATPLHHSRLFSRLSHTIPKSLMLRILCWHGFELDFEAGKVRFDAQKYEGGDDLHVPNSCIPTNIAKEVFSSTYADINNQPGVYAVFRQLCLLNKEYANQPAVKPLIPLTELPADQQPVVKSELQAFGEKLVSGLQSAMDNTANGVIDRLTAEREAREKRDHDYMLSETKNRKEEMSNLLSSIFTPPTKGTTEVTDLNKQPEAAHLQMTPDAIRRLLRSYGLRVGLDPSNRTAASVSIPSARDFGYEFSASKMVEVNYKFEDVESAWERASAGNPCNADTVKDGTYDHPKFLNDLLVELAKIPKINPEPEKLGIIARLKRDQETAAAAAVPPVVAVALKRDDEGRRSMEVELGEPMGAKEAGQWLSGLTGVRWHANPGIATPNDAMDYAARAFGSGSAVDLSTQAQTAKDLHGGTPDYNTTMARGLNIHSKEYGVLASYITLPPTPAEQLLADVEFFEKYGLMVTYSVALNKIDVMLPHVSGFGYVGGRIGGEKTRYSHDAVSKAFHAATHHPTKRKNTALKELLLTTMIDTPKEGEEVHDTTPLIDLTPRSLHVWDDTVRTIKEIAGRIASVSLDPAAAIGNAEVVTNPIFGAGGYVCHQAVLRLWNLSNTSYTVKGIASEGQGKLLVHAVKQMLNSVNYCNSPGRTASDPEYVNMVGLTAAGRMLGSNISDNVTADNSSLTNCLSAYVFATVSAAALSATEAVDRAVVAAQGASHFDEVAVQVDEPPATPVEQNPEQPSLLDQLIGNLERSYSSEPSFMTSIVTASAESLDAIKLGLINSLMEVHKDLKIVTAAVNYYVDGEIFKIRGDASDKPDAPRDEQGPESVPPQEMVTMSIQVIRNLVKVLRAQGKLPAVGENEDEPDPTDTLVEYLASTGNKMEISVVATPSDEHTGLQWTVPLIMSSEPRLYTGRNAVPSLTAEESFPYASTAEEFFSDEYILRYVLNSVPETQRIDLDLKNLPADLKSVIDDVRKELNHHLSTAVVHRAKTLLEHGAHLVTDDTSPFRNA